MTPEELNAIEERLARMATGDIADDVEQLVGEIQRLNEELSAAYAELNMWQRHVWQGLPLSQAMRFYQDVDRELTRAMGAYPRMNSAHEAYAVILEEVEELWQEIKVKQANHDHAAMRKEVVQVAAMLARFVVDVLGVPDGDA